MNTAHATIRNEMKMGILGAVKKPYTSRRIVAECVRAWVLLS